MKTVLLLSDWHVGSGNFGKLRIRVKKIVDECLTKLNSKNPLIIFILGDMIDGSYYNKNVSINAQLDECSELIFYTIERLKSKFKIESIQCVPGNHGKFKANSMLRTVDTNDESILYEMLGFKSYNAVKHFGILGIHGDFGYARYNISFADKIKLVANDFKAKTIVMGHFHHPRIVCDDGISIIGNGTIKIPGSYEEYNGYNIDNPCQICFEYDGFRISNIKLLYGR